MEQNFNIHEKELVEAYQKSNDQKMLGQLFLPYKDLVFGVCLKYLKNSSDAEDAVNSIYELVALKIKTHEVKNFKSWLYVVSKNYCFEVLRKKSRKIEKEKDAADMYSEQVFHLDTIDKEELLVKLETCLEKLEKDQQNCIRQFYYEKKSYHQIAESSGISWSKVRSYIQNGRRMIKKCMMD